MLETPVTELYNSLNNASLAGQHAARYKLTGDVNDLSNALSTGSSAVLGLAGPASLVPVRSFGGFAGSTYGIGISNQRGSVGLVDGTVGANTAASTLGRIESRFGGASREVGFIVDAETGKILTMARQTYGQVNSSFRFTPEQWSTADGNWITHNHPSGLTLGIEDLASAVSNGARGIRASTSTGTFELSFDKSFAAAYRGEPGAAFGFIQSETNVIGRGIMADVKNGTLVVPEGITGLQYRGFLSNEMWIRYADQTPGLQYTFTPRKFP